MRPDVALEELKAAIAPLLHGRRDVVFGASQTGDGSKECVVLRVEPATGPCRYLKLHSTDEVAPQWRYTWLWSSYRATDENGNRDGRGLGDLSRALDAVRHWIVEGMRWQDVPEFGLPSAAAGSSDP